MNLLGKLIQTKVIGPCMDEGLSEGFTYIFLRIWHIFKLKVIVENSKQEPRSYLNATKIRERQRFCQSNKTKHSRSRKRTVKLQFGHKNWFHYFHIFFLAIKWHLKMKQKISSTEEVETVEIKKNLCIRL